MITTRCHFCSNLKKRPTIESRDQARDAADDNSFGPSFCYGRVAVSDDRWVPAASGSARIEIQQDP
jgi:hypothetical protein